MTKELSARLSYALVLSIVLLMTGFLGLGVRAFASVRISDSIFLGAFGVFLVAVSLYFVPFPLAAPCRASRNPAFQTEGGPSGNSMFMDSLRFRKVLDR
jgi:uncharacterized membrane protein YfcA